MAVVLGKMIYYICHFGFIKRRGNVFSDCRQMSCKDTCASKRPAEFESQASKRAKNICDVIPLHKHARSKHPDYPERATVPDDKVPWEMEWKDYAPEPFEHAVVRDNDCTVKPKGWADSANIKLVDFGSRHSYANEQAGKRQMKFDDENGAPLNPAGRTGMIGRGLLGKWGPNHAADPIVTRCAMLDGVQVLQMVAIKRKDTGAWAIPGGMVDQGESVSVTLQREFKEEAGNLPAEQRAVFNALANQLFATGTMVYKGYVDDPRNTDNAWIETTAVHYHCNDELGTMLPLHAGDDAAEVQWLTIQIGCPTFDGLYANHKQMVLKACKSFGYNA